MFGRKKEDEDAQLGIPGEGDSQAARPATAPAAAPRVRPAPYTGKPEVVRRAPTEFPSPQRRADSPSYGESKRLIVGRDIVLTGSINSCDKLVVEGRVEASLTDCREIEIAETGTFKGEAEIEVAEISGRFEGNLTARELLLVRAKGSVAGTVRFGRLEVERGGEIEGDISVVPTGPQSALTGPTPVEPAEAVGT